MSFLKKEQLVKGLKFILPPVLWASVIFFFSSLPTIRTTDFYLWDFLLKKTAHFVEYGILSVLIYRALINYGFTNNKSKLIAIFVSVLYAISDEFHQSFVPGRGPAVRDVIIDTAGAVTFIYSIPLLTVIKKMIY